MSSTFRYGHNRNGVYQSLRFTGIALKIIEYQIVAQTHTPSILYKQIQLRNMDSRNRDGKSGVTKHHITKVKINRHTHIHSRVAVAETHESKLTLQSRTVA